ncbi:DUF4395 family protein [Inhella inkyongensis]|uniref:DUF4395 family protein n=1 Tax=Inhella inkyongensis TaxID=392593 RepID=UPI00110DB792
MLRFDLPQVPSNVIRWEALLNTVTCLLALLVSPWFMLIPTVQGFIKGILGHARCPAHVMWRKVFSAKGWLGRLEDAGPKMFAAKILFLASAVSLTLYMTGTTLWRVPVVVLVVFTCLEWLLSFCAACWAYGLWYRHFPASRTR